MACEIAVSIALHFVHSELHAGLLLTLVHPCSSVVNPSERGIANVNQAFGNKASRANVTMWYFRTCAWVRVSSREGHHQEMLHGFHMDF